MSTASRLQAMFRNDGSRSIHQRTDLVALVTAAFAASDLATDLSPQLGAALDTNGFPVRNSVGAAAAAVAQSFGASVTEGYEVKVIDETLSALAAVSTDLTEDIPAGAVLLSIQGNIETLVVGAGTSVKVGIGPTSDPDKYGITSALTKNLKIDTIPIHAVLGSAEDLKVNMCATGGGIGDSAASAGAVRVRIVYAVTNSLDDAA